MLLLNLFEKFYPDAFICIYLELVRSIFVLLLLLLSSLLSLLLFFLGCSRWLFLLLSFLSFPFLFRFFFLFVLDPMRFKTFSTSLRIGKNRIDTHTHTYIQRETHKYVSLMVSFMFVHSFILFVLYQIRNFVYFWAYTTHTHIAFHSLPFHQKNINIEEIRFFPSFILARVVSIQKAQHQTKDDFCSFIFPIRASV